MLRTLSTKGFTTSAVVSDRQTTGKQLDLQECWVMYQRKSAPAPPIDRPLLHIGI